MFLYSEKILRRQHSPAYSSVPCGHFVVPFSCGAKAPGRGEDLAVAKLFPPPLSEPRLSAIIRPMVNIGNDWDQLLEGEFEKEYYQKLREFLIREYKTRVIYPDMYDLFNALKFTPYKEVKAVILGQDPYHQPGQAHGLCFSVQKGVPAPPSLVNVFKELKADLGIDPPGHGCLESWAKNGVLLLNTVLTVRRSQPNSHRGKGWEIFTDQVIRLLNEREDPMVFILWGGNARAKQSLITNNRHLILTGAHPSPLGADKGFWSGNYFSKTNAFLKRFGKEPIDWRIPK